MKYVSLFAGIGGFDLALNRLGHECVYVNEWDKYAAQTYEKNFCNWKHAETCSSNGRTKPDTWISDGNGWRPCTNYVSGKRETKVDTRSITEVSAESIPDHDILVGGFPCQAFSVAGKRRGFDETRGTLFFDIARILQKKRPRYFILENVKGLLSHDNGRTFKTIITTLDELRYDVQWQVLNSKNFGVPQNRERVFIVGHLRGEPRPKVFPIGSNSKKDSEIHSGTQQTANTVVSTYARNQSDGQHITRIPPKFLNRNQRNIEGDYAYTVDSMNTGGVMQDMKIRRLTPIECERLQGFPDNWTEGVSDTQRYKQLGNAVTVNVVYEVAKRL